MEIVNFFKECPDYMSPIDIKPVPATAAVNTVSSGGAKVLSQLLKAEGTINLQVLKVLTATSVAFQAGPPGGPVAVTLNFSDVSPFTPGSKWVLQKAPDSQELYVKPAVTNEGAGKSKPVIVGKGGDSASLVSLLAKEGRAVLPKGSGAVSPASQVIQGHQAFSGTSEKVLAPHRHDAAIKQNSLSGVFSSLSSVVSGGSVQASPQSEKAIADVARQILGLRLTSDVTAQAVKQVVKASGVFHDAKAVPEGIRGGAAGAEGADRGLAGKLTEGIDLKGKLVELGTLLRSSGVKVSSASHTVSGNVPPLPERDGAVLGQKAAVLPKAEQPNVFASKLLEQVIEGLSRIKLLQIASLPQADGDHIQSGENAKLQFNMELPLALAPNQTAIIGLRVTRDGQHPEHDKSGHGRGWSIDMAMDTEETGAIDAHIHLAPKGLRISVWSEDKDFSELLKGSVERLRAGLAEEGLDVDSLQVMRGRRMDWTKYEHHSAGYFYDSSM